jgi:CheY-like chemotaxis protein
LIRKLETQPELADVAVLVVDDDDDMRDLLVEVLAVCGARVTGVSSASEALEVVIRDQPAILLSDIGMPGEDGYSLIRRIRALPDARNRRMPAAAITAFHRPKDRLRAFCSGFQMYLVKPLDVSAIIAAAVGLARMALCPTASD